MLYDIFQLPSRLPEYTELETILPCFSGEWVGEDVTTYGRIFQVPEVFKYKAIELNGNTTIERIFATEEDVDFTKSWWTSKMDMIPLSMKIFERGSFSCVSYRYMEGIENLLSKSNWDGRATPINLETLRIAQRVLRSQKQYDTYRNLNKIKKDKKHLIHKLVSNDDFLNLRTLQYMTIYDKYGIGRDNLHGQYVDIFPDVWMPNFNIRDYGTQLTVKDDLKLSDFGKTKVRNFGSLGCSTLMSGYEEPFDSSEIKVSYYEQDDDVRESFQELLSSLEKSAYTDIFIELSVYGGKTTSQKMELYSRYFGITDYKTLDFQYTHTVEEFQRVTTNWIQRLVGIRKECKVTIKKNWLEEVYIEITVDNNTIHYYVDLVIHGLGSLSVLET